MKLAIMSDVHLGEIKFRKQINGQNAWYCICQSLFKKCLEMIKRMKCDALLIPGDLFDSPNPDIGSIITASALNDLPMPVLLIGGNHEFSLRNQRSGYHPFDILNVACKVIDDYLMYELGDEEKKVVITMLPYRSLSEENYAKVFRGALSEKRGSFNVLMVHGYLANKGDALNEYTLPEEVAINYDLVVMGHIHNPSVIQTRYTTILSPGSVMPSQVYAETPSIWTFDTVTGRLERYQLEEAPKMHEIFVENGINTCLERILQGINETGRLYDLYSIKYSGSVKDIDELIYKKVHDSTLSLIISTVEQRAVSDVPDHVEVFWDFIRKNHPEWEDEFKTIRKEIKI